MRITGLAIGISILLFLSATANASDLLPNSFNANPLTELSMSSVPNTPPECKPIEVRLLANIGAYATAAAKESNAIGAAWIGDVIKQTVDSQTGTLCENDVLTVYSVGAYFISQRNLIEGSSYWTESISPDDTLSLRKIGILLSLIKNKKLNFLTKKARSILQSPWDDQSLFGAYDCNETQVFIDPNHRPFDLGSIIEHELDHLMRDKYLKASSLESEFTVNGKINWEMYLTLDETLAGLAAANLQRFQVPSLYVHGKLVETRDFFMRKKKWPYSIPGRYEALGDFNFRNPNGPAEALFQSGILEDPAVKMTDAASMSNKKVLKRYLPILRLIHNGYFAESSEFDTHKSSLLKQHDIGLLPLHGYQNNNISEGGISYQSESSSFFQNPKKTLELVRLVMDDLDEKLSSRSSTCAMFNDAVRSNQIGPYLGLKFKTPIVSRPGETGSRPGETGSRPGTSIRPCLSVAKEQ